ncbi:hypothetical protein PHLGIDRAFT_122343 [Phlebiopsis gigantea 11061_1 CR5-6]|uniref:F-box domain-containing protein n=1 Tax=Phlebiopsis gigantea (strain 11061_1 CR5-6) TaxID=745531 RepID=A0A0C3S3S8_PHLG1|nr:hypothetical protein PHLGIDRAFT_122343 [Phlebiopsis gigantea 11061_1 CR5-6]
MSSASLPAELEDIILDHLHDDRKALAACSLVRRSWLPASRYHYWRKLRLECSSNELDRLDRLFTLFPDVVGHVRDVIFSRTKNELFKTYDLTLIYALLVALTKLPALTSVSLKGLRFYSGHTPFSLSRGPTLHTFRRLCITSCTFADFTDITYLRAIFPMLTALHLDEVWWGSYASASPPSTSPQTHTPFQSLTELTVGDCFSRSRVFDWLLTSSSQLDGLETLRLPMMCVYDSRLPELLAAAGTSLRHLDIGSAYVLQQSPVSSRLLNAAGPTQLAANLNLTHNNALRTLTLGVPAFHDPRFGAPCIVAVLARVASPVLAEVRFVLPADAREAEAVLRRPGWDRAADALSHTAVRRVAFALGQRDAKAARAVQGILESTVAPRFRLLGSKSIEMVVQIAY